MPVGPLMEEHRVIEKIIPIIRRLVEAGRCDGTIDVRQAEMVLDFIRTYADRCHHGKEEGILFAALECKPLTAAHRKTLDELSEEHRQGRQVVRELAEAIEGYRCGDRAKLPLAIERLEFLADFYPRHIRKEDVGFFLPVMGYLDAAEKEKLIQAEREFDRCLIHAIYREKVKGAGPQKMAPRQDAPVIRCPGEVDDG